MTYEGYDILLVNYNRLGAIADRHHRRFVLLDGNTGKRTVDELSPAPAPLRPFIWTAFGRPEMKAQRDWLDARKGRAVPFWLPSYQWDMSLAEDLLETADTVTVSWVRYAQQLFGATGARRHVWLWTLGAGASDAYKVTAATDPGDGLTETLSITPAAVRLYDKGQTVISFLRLCRLEEDLVEVRYPSTEVAEATIQVRELPLEAPL